MASIGSESKATVSRSETHPVVCTADSALLTWNAFSSPFDTIQYYELLFRNHGDTGWISLNDTIPTNDTPHVTIYHSQFGNGFFDFAVKSISAGGLTSNPHSSLDSTASVSEGWYLQWDVND